MFEALIQSQPLLKAQLRGSDVQWKIQVSGTAFPLMVCKDVFERLSEIILPATKTVTYKVAVKEFIVPLDERARVG